MSRLYDAELELRAVFSILNGPERIRQRLLASIADEHFGYPVAKELLGITKRAIANKRRHQTGPGDVDDGSLPIPSSRALQEAPGVSQEAKIILAKPRDPIESRHDIPALLASLETYRKIRVVQRECKKVVTNMRGSIDQVDLDLVRDHLINAVEGIQDYDAGRSVTIMRGQEGKDLVRESLKLKKLIPTGFKNYDEKGGGIEYGDLIVCAAPSGHGKSIMLLTLATYLYLHQNMSVVIATYELERSLYVQRLIANVCGVPFDKIRTGKYNKSEIATIKREMSRFFRHGAENNCKFAIMEPGNSSVEELGLTLKPHGFNTVVVDHLNHVRHSEGESDWQRLGYSARQMKRQAVGNHQIWITATQLNDDSQKISYSRMIRDEADTGWGWVLEEGSDVVKVKPIKARHHEPFEFYLQKDFGLMSFRDSAGPMTLSEGDEFVKQMDEIVRSTG